MVPTSRQLSPALRVLGQHDGDDLPPQVSREARKDPPVAARDPGRRAGSAGWPCRATAHLCQTTGTPPAPPGVPELPLDVCTVT